jgi:hypothetical protein
MDILKIAELCGVVVAGILTACSHAPYAPPPNIVVHEGRR